MIEINAKTEETRNTCEHVPQVFGYWRMNITPSYVRGWCPPNYPMPALGDQMILVHPVVLWMHDYCDEHGHMPF